MHAKHSAPLNQRQHAIVVGSGIGGLLAARVLAEFFQQVTIIERDVIKEEEAPLIRKGVPQGAHSHLLMMKGLLILNKFFPGFDAIQEAKGARKIDMYKDIETYINGHWMPTFSSSTYGYLQSRPLLESTLQSFIRAYRSISFMYDKKVYDLLMTEDQTVVLGVKIKSASNDNQREELKGDLIVDASGRNTDFPGWLHAMGYQIDKVEIKNDIYYSSRVYQCPAMETSALRCKIVRQSAPYKKKSSLLTEIEKSGERRQWIVTLIGQLGDYPENTEEEFIEFAQQLEQADIYQFIEQATAVSPIFSFRSLASFHYKYEKAAHLPKGLIVMGDAFYTFNPIFGQGMTACMISADVLRDLLLKYDNTDHIQKAYFKQTAKILDRPWNQAMKQDFIYPEIEGQRPWGFTLDRWYKRQLFQLCQQDPRIWTIIYRMINLEALPSELLRPSIIMQVVKLKLRQFYQRLFTKLNPYDS